MGTIGGVIYITEYNWRFTPGLIKYLPNHNSHHIEIQQYCRRYYGE